MKRDLLTKIFNQVIYNYENIKRDLTRGVMVIKIIEKYNLSCTPYVLFYVINKIGRGEYE